MVTDLGVNATPRPPGGGRYARRPNIMELAERLGVDPSKPSATRVNDPVIVIGIPFSNFALNFIYVISD